MRSVKSPIPPSAMIPTSTSSTMRCGGSRPAVGSAGADSRVGAGAGGCACAAAGRGVAVTVGAMVGFGVAVAVGGTGVALAVGAGRVVGAVVRVAVGTTELRALPAVVVSGVAVAAEATPGRSGVG